MNIFTEASGSLVSAAMIKSLKDAGLVVVASDITKNNAGGILADKYIKVPDMSDENLSIQSRLYTAYKCIAIMQKHFIQENEVPSHTI